MDIYYIFPLSLILTLILSFLFVKAFRGLLFTLKFRGLFPILLSAVYIHEVLHFIIMALVTLKWPKWDGVSIENTKNGSMIKGGVKVSFFSYKNLFYNLLHGQFVLESIYLVHQLIASFLIGLAPVIFPYLLLYYFFLSQGISFEVFNLDTAVFMVDWWKMIFLTPLIFYGALIASPSWADIKQALPLFFILFLLPIPALFLNFLLFVSLCLFIGIMVLLVLRGAVKILK